MGRVLAVVPALQHLVLVVLVVYATSDIQEMELTAQVIPFFYRIFLVLLFLKYDCWLFLFIFVFLYFC